MSRVRSNTEALISVMETDTRMMDTFGELTKLTSLERVVRVLRAIVGTCHV